MKNKQISLLTVLFIMIACSIASPMIGNVEASPFTIIEVYPETTEQSIGDTFTVDLNIVSVGLWGMQFVIRWNPNILQLVEVEIVQDWPVNLNVTHEMIGVPTIDIHGYDCDVLPDGVLDIYDLCTLAVALGTEQGSPDWNPRADINNDGWVFINDAVLLLNAWVETGIQMPGTIQFLFIDLEYEFEGSATFTKVTFEVIDFGTTVLDLDNIKMLPVPHLARDGTVTVPFHPVKATEYLVATIESWNLPKGTENSLTSKLEAALDLLNRDNVDGAVHKLGDFINRVEAMRGKKLTNEQADCLVARAQAIIDFILG